MDNKQKLLEEARLYRETSISKGQSITYNDLVEFDILATNVYKLKEDYRQDLSRVLLGLELRSLTEEYLSTFWYVDGDFIGDEAEISDTSKIVEYGDFIQVDRDHYSIWNKVKHSHPSTRNKEYDEIPRGRVLFNTKTQRFQVVTSPEMIENHKEEIIKWFNLPPNKTDFVEDEHYIPVILSDYEFE